MWKNKLLFVCFVCASASINYYHHHRHIMISVFYDYCYSIYTLYDYIYSILLCYFYCTMEMIAVSDTKVYSFVWSHSFHIEIIWFTVKMTPSFFSHNKRNVTLNAYYGLFYYMVEWIIKHCVYMEAATSHQPPYMMSRAALLLFDMAKCYNRCIYMLRMRMRMHWPGLDRGLTDGSSKWYWKGMKVSKRNVLVLSSFVGCIEPW